MYEDSYEVDTADSEYGQYHPDFHIAGTRIYIEYFGIDRKGNVAPFMVDHDSDAKEKYREGMEWKRSIHARCGTDLIELYSYNRSEGNLLEELEKKLAPFNLKTRSIPPEEIFNKTLNNDRRRLGTVVSTFATAIITIKSTGKSWNETYPKPDSNSQENYLGRMEKVLKPIYDAYQSKLSAEKEIDFEDILNIASDRISSGMYIHPYKYVIVDEYQDISRSKYRLLDAMRRSKDYHLFCVGDDWQSIYRFNGSDVSYILDFEKYWGPSAVCAIERTYRFSGNILRISSEFICRNKRQYRKNLIGNTESEGRVIPIMYQDDTEMRRRIADILTQVPHDKKFYSWEGTITTLSF